MAARSSGPESAEVRRASAGSICCCCCCGGFGGGFDGGAGGVRVGVFVAVLMLLTLPAEGGGGGFVNATGAAGAAGAAATLELALCFYCGTQNVDICDCALVSFFLLGPLSCRRARADFLVRKCIATAHARGTKQDKTGQDRTQQDKNYDTNQDGDSRSADGFFLAGDDSDSDSCRRTSDSREGRRGRYQPRQLPLLTGAGALPI